MASTSGGNQSAQTNNPPSANRRRHRPPRAAGPQEPAAGENGNPEPQRGNPRARGRGARRGRGSNVQAVMVQTAQIADSSIAVSTDSATPNPAPRRGGARGRARDRGRGGSAGPATPPVTARTVNGRRFGGELTQHVNASIDSLPGAPPSLNADAPVFKPGQRQGHAVRPTKQKPPPRKQRASKSAAPDLPTRIHEDIDNLQYDCGICINPIQRNSSVWSCRTCWTVFHFPCIKKWSASASPERHEQLENGNQPNPQWRCPGCNLPQEVFPKSATCWCERETGQRSIPGLPPFSCGQTCSREHVLPKKCPHPCQEICHAGPCPPCSGMRPAQMCFCGKESSTRRCVDTLYDSGWSCGAVCGELMPCGEHSCPRPCHEGLCGACTEPVPARCYCGKVEKTMACCDCGDEAQSTINQDTWTGTFNCLECCGRDFDCGKHACEKECHAQDAHAAHCPRSPDVVSHCPCGKTALADMPHAPRQTCEDPIPNCTKACEIPLPCGHLCPMVCHSGDCMTCLRNVSINCRCGRATLQTLCHQGRKELPQCMKVCRAMLNCGRHNCDERCCSGERKASERLASKRRLKRINVDSARMFNEGVEAEHICTMTCGRLLKCGTHECQELCHRGPCGSCREAIFDDLRCNCGRTVLQSPLPCGTKPPACRYECERPKACGHPQVAHNCHMDDESCPKCPFLTTKFCMCGKHQMKNQPCWLTEVRCGEVCGAKLKSCRMHSCRSGCHRPGECEDAVTPCQQVCGKEKSCGHADSSPCHAPAVCREDQACSQKMLITCSCQRVKKEAPCHATRHTRGNLDKTLDCDDECARLERNRRLAVALNIDPEQRADDHIPYSTQTLDMFLSNPQWAQQQEKEFRLLAANPDSKRLRFKPMPFRQRAFLHSLAEDFGFDSESMDPEPHRHVAVFKTPRFVMAPMKTLAECGRIQQRLGLASAAAVQSEAQKKSKASNVVGDPYNAFLLTNVKFGLTLEELRSAIRPALAGHAQLELDIDFLPNEDVVLSTKPARGGALTPRAEHDMENSLMSIKAPMARQINAHGHGNLQLCRVDQFLNVLRRETDGASNGGWSQVAANAAAPRRAPVPLVIGHQSSFTVLSSSSTKKKKKAERKESIVDDWELAELEIEQAWNCQR